MTHPAQACQGADAYHHVVWQLQKPPMSVCTVHDGGSMRLQVSIFGYELGYCQGFVNHQLEKVPVWYVGGQHTAGIDTIANGLTWCVALLVAVAKALMLHAIAAVTVLSKVSP